MAERRQHSAVCQSRQRGDVLMSDKKRCRSYSDFRTKDELRDSIVTKLLIHGKKYAPNATAERHQPAIEPPLDLSYSTGLLAAGETDTSGPYKRCPDEAVLQLAAKRKCVRCDFVAEDANTSYLHYQLHRKLQSGMDWHRNYVDGHKQSERDTPRNSCSDDSSTLRTLLRGYDSIQSLSCRSPSCLRSSGSVVCRPGYSSSSDARSVDSTPRSSPPLGFITGMSSPVERVGSVMVHPGSRLVSDPSLPVANPPPLRDRAASEMVRPHVRLVPDPPPLRDRAGSKVVRPDGRRPGADHPSAGDKAVPGAIHPRTRLEDHPKPAGSSGDADPAPDVSVVKCEHDDENVPSGADYPVGSAPYPRHPKVDLIQPFEILDKTSAQGQRWPSLAARIPLRDPDPEAADSVRFRDTAPKERSPERNDVSIQCDLPSEAISSPLPDSRFVSEVNPRCHYCGITFDDDVMYSIHMGCHNHRDPFICNVCGKSSDNKYTFYTHIMRGHEYS